MFDNKKTTLFICGNLESELKTFKLDKYEHL